MSKTLSGFPTIVLSSVTLTLLASLACGCASIGTQICLGHDNRGKCSSWGRDPNGSQGTLDRLSHEQAEHAEAARHANITGSWSSDASSSLSSGSWSSSGSASSSRRR